MIMQENQCPDTQRLPVIESTRRRNFFKNASLAGVLSAGALLGLPRRAAAWLNGKFQERQDLADAVKVLQKTYSDITPYPHKFNDALVKLQLRDLDFAVKQGFDKKFADHFVLTLGVPIERHIKPAIGMLGKDCFLWGVFERTSCSYQLYEHINIDKKNERSFPCPYKPILGHIQGAEVNYGIAWEDVCEKWCSRIWNGFAATAGVKIKIMPGDTCRVKVI
ncbi:MAG: hypothetical protein JW832_13825 [Deltaproteobacteria bacterium]|nr:hypothetical protein [Deltaproteobacteria bacterium]